MSENPSESDIESVARWVHAAYLALLPEGNAKRVAWDIIAPKYHEQYRGVARRLLTSPPTAIRKAVRSLEAAGAH